MVDYLVVGWPAFQTLSRWCRRNGVLLHCHRATHAVIDRQRNHGVHWRVLAKWCRMVGGDHVHNGTVVGKLEGDRAATIGVNDLLREDFVPEDRSGGIYFDQPWASLAGMFPVASGGIHVWHMPELVAIFGDDAVLQFGGGTLGHPWGNAAGATANRVALEAVIKARGEGRDLAAEGRRRGTRHGRGRGREPKGHAEHLKRLCPASDARAFSLHRASWALSSPIMINSRRAASARVGERACGGSGIRTREGVAPLHALQACPFVRSGKPPGQLYGKAGRRHPSTAHRGGPPSRGGWDSGPAGSRRRRDSNTRGAVKPLTAFEAVPFVRSGTPPGRV